MYPKIRASRARRTDPLRRLSQEARLHPDDLILPLFVVAGSNRTEPIDSMPGVARMSTDRIVALANDLTVPAVLLFGVPTEDEKDQSGAAACDPDGPVPTAIRKLKAACPHIAVITDICACAYLTHGHCGILDDTGQIITEPSLELISQMALTHAQAGADMVAPSAMLDGQVATIRQHLDEAGLTNTAIMSYSTKFASAFYGPFRHAAQSGPQFGDRRAYQLPIANRKEALRQSLLDQAEAADWLMVKPAGPYLDIIRDLNKSATIPIAAYQVSGEYAMLKHAARAAAFEEQPAVLESLTALKRAGATAIITYYAQQAATWLNH